MYRLQDLAALLSIRELIKFVVSLPSLINRRWVLQPRTVGLKASSRSGKRQAVGVRKKRRVDSGETERKEWVEPSALRRDRRGVEFEGEVWEIWGCSRDLDEVVQNGPKNSQVGNV